jgi:hypothetical protein
MLTKSLLSLLLIVVLESSEYSELIWQVSVSLAQERQFLGVKKILYSLQLTKVGSLLTIWTTHKKHPDAHQCSKKFLNTSTDTNHRELMFVQMSGQPSGQQLLWAPICTGVRTANWRLWTMNIASNRLEARAIPSELDDWRLMKKHVTLHNLKSVVACCPDAHCQSLDATQRTSN